MNSDSLPQTYKALAAKEDTLPRRLVEVPLPKPGQNQILVKMAYAPLNQTDLLCSDGFYRLTAQSPYFVGLEGSGFIAELGPDVKSNLKIGDKVHVHAFGTLAQYVLVDSSFVLPIKGDLTLEEAASHMNNPGAAAYMVDLALKGGHKAVVSTAASSALGKMLVRAFKEKGIKTINTVRKDEYIEDLKKEGADYVLNSESGDFEEKLKEIAAKEGATIAFDGINGDFTDKLVKVMPANSTIHAYGYLGGTKYNIFEEHQFDDGKSVKGFMGGYYFEEFRQKGELDKCFEGIHSKLKTTYKTEIHKIYPIDEIIEALEYYEKNSSKGKVLIKLN